MDSKRAYELIDSYNLDNCRALLYTCAPDLCIQLDQMMSRGVDHASLLSAARDMLKQAYLRENN